MEDRVREARNHGLTEGDPGDEQPAANIPEWLKDNPRCLYERAGLRCIRQHGHKSQHEAPGTPECCYKPESCWGRTSCPQQPACSS